MILLLALWRSDHGIGLVIDISARRHLWASVTKRHNFVPGKWRWCSAAGKVNLNLTLRNSSLSIARLTTTSVGATEIAGLDKSARSKLQGVENAGVDNLARDDKGGQGGSGNTGQINLTKSCPLPPCPPLSSRAVLSTPAFSAPPSPYCKHARDKVKRTSFGVHLLFSDGAFWSLVPADGMS